uniref:Uncharacterized protein n=1 Tax=Arundo donax TaxID=35708 RepID=A0A0A9FJT8_ARUDO
MDGELLQHLTPPLLVCHSTIPDHQHCADHMDGQLFRPLVVEVPNHCGLDLHLSSHIGPRISDARFPGGLSILDGSASNPIVGSSCIVNPPLNPGVGSMASFSSSSSYLSLMVSLAPNPSWHQARVALTHRVVMYSRLNLF